MSDSTLRKILKSICGSGPGQALQVQGSGLDHAEILAALEQGLAPTIFSEQAADAAASDVRVARVFYAPRPYRVLTLGIVVDTTVAADPANYKTFDVKKFANGGAIGSALATQIATTTALTARTKSMFTLTGTFIDLAAGDILVVDIGVASSGVQLPKFAIIGTTQVI